jgi:TatD DNase family protein
MNTIAYVYKDNLYLNITNRCMMSCPYCMKRKWDNDFRGDDLKLDAEPTVEETIKAIGDPKKHNEIVFCGYGDALIRPQEVREIAKWIKENGGKTRINTAGLANKFFGRNVLPELEGLIDAVSISLNGTNARQFNEINKPHFGEESFEAVLEFVRQAKKYIPETVITAVDFKDLNTDAVSQIAEDLGVKFRLRPYE